MIEKHKVDPEEHTIKVRQSSTDTENRYEAFFFDNPTPDELRGLKGRGRTQRNAINDLFDKFERISLRDVSRGE